MIRLTDILNESPDKVKANGMKLFHHSRDARAFGYVKRKGGDTILDIADPGVMHRDTPELKAGGRSIPSTEGRMWTKSKVISFWYLKKLNIPFIKKLRADIKKQLNIDIFSNGWMIETDWWNSNLVPVKDYVSGKAKASQADTVRTPHVASPVAKGKQTVPKGVGSKKKGGIGAYRRAANRRGLHEIGDGSAKPYKTTISDTTKTTKDSWGDEEHTVNVKWRFTTDSGVKYTINVHPERTRNNDMDVQMAFYTSKMDYDELTNKGEMYRVMATVMKALTYLVKNHGRKIEAIIAVGEPKRMRIYHAFIKGNSKIKKMFRWMNLVTPKELAMYPDWSKLPNTR